MNEDLKYYARKKGIFLWEVAERLGIADSSLSRKLRRRFSEEEREKFILCVDELAKKKYIGSNE